MTASEERKPLRILVTGGGGFLGHAIVAQLVARGDDVRTFARGEYPELTKLGVDTVRGDLADGDAMQRACANRDVVFHVAARPGLWGNFDEYHRPNVLGTEHVIAACRDCGVGRLIYTSSPSVVFAGYDIAGGDESLPYPPRYRSHYSATKATAEQLILKANAPALRTAVLRPHLIWGPGDNHILPRLISRARVGRLVQIGNGRNVVDTTYIDNAAEAHLLAADALEQNPNVAGRVFFITNDEPRPVSALINDFLRAADAPLVSRRVSRRFAWLAGAGLEAVHTIFGRRTEPAMTRFLATELATTHWFDIRAARQELGYRPRISIDEGLKRLRKWYETHGFP